MELFLVRIFLYLDCIRGFTPQISKFCPNTGKYGPKTTPYLDTFHEVSEVDNKDTTAKSLMLFLGFYCWLWTNFVHWCSWIFDIFHKFMFSLFLTNKHHPGRVSKIEKNRWHKTLLKCSSRKCFGIKKCFAYNNDNSTINEMLYSKKLEA